jgi:hypothetical protein
MIRVGYRHKVIAIWNGPDGGVYWRIGGDGDNVANRADSIAAASVAGQAEIRERNAVELRNAGGSREMVRYYRRKRLGLCVMCGKRPPITEKVLCPRCVKRRYEYDKRYEQKRKAAAI